MNDSQQQTADRVLDLLRGAAAWPRHSRPHGRFKAGSPKRGGTYDASFGQERLTRVLVCVDARAVALFLVDHDGTLAAIELRPPLRDDAELRAAIAAYTEGSNDER